MGFSGISGSCGEAAEWLTVGPMEPDVHSDGPRGPVRIGSSALQTALTSRRLVPDLVGFRCWRISY